MPPKQRKRKETAPAPPVAPPSGAVRIGFSRDARAVFEGLSTGVRAGLRRKLRDFGGNPAVGKPLVGALKGYHRITYGRLRAVAHLQIVATVSDGVVIVFVLYIGLRSAGSRDDPYELAAEALRRGEADAIEALELMVQQHHAGDPSDREEV